MRIPNSAPEPIRDALEGLHLTETYETSEEHEELTRDATVFLDQLSVSRDAFIVSLRTTAAASRYLSVDRKGVILFDGEEADALTWLGTMLCRPERELFLYVQLLIVAAQTQIGAGRVDNGLMLAQCAHRQLDTFARAQGRYPILSRPASRSGLALAAMVADVIPRFICAHEIGHHFVTNPSEAGSDIKTLRDLYADRDLEPIAGTSAVFSRTKKPDVEYEISKDGHCTATRSASVDRFPKPKKWDGYFPEVAADLFGILFVTEYASRRSIPPLTLLHLISVVFKTMEMRSGIRTLLDTTPAKGVGGIAHFPYSRFAYRASMLPVIVAAIADGRLKGTPVASEYWSSNRQELAVDERTRPSLVEEMELLHIVCRRGLLQALMPTVPDVRLDDFPPDSPVHIRGILQWISAPFAIPQEKFVVKGTYAWVDERGYQALSGWACACMDIARMKWDSNSFRKTYGDDYPGQCSNRSEAELFDIVGKPLWDVIDGTVTFPPGFD
jgi:hypothetical protein